MTFFDLNIPYTDSPSHKTTRLKQTIKLLELGYTGVAYTRSITGVMSESHRCSISLFPLSSILKLSPSISTSVNLHRQLLNIPLNTPFRQYTRVTVVVDSVAQGAALNSGNPVIKSYDLVAVLPLKQDVFDQACKNYEVDIIAIDFSETRFRLKQPLIKAAIERGVYFEITYSGLIMDTQLRRQMISNTKLLVDWTRGKNVIFSSAAPSVTELRGPYDVANLACLLGFSMERAKASVSKACRSLLESSLRKKKFIKEAIRIELLSQAEQTDGFDDWLKWDPISSGEGDLQLDDMAKSFAASNRESKKVKAIDFVTIMDGLPSHGLQFKDMVYDSNLDSKIHDQPKNDHTSVMDTLGEDHLLNIVNSKPSLANEKFEVIDSVKVGESCDMVIEEEPKIPTDLNACVSCPEAEQQNLQAEVHEACKGEANNEDGDANVYVSDEKGTESIFSGLSTAGIVNSVDDNPSTLQCEEANDFSSGAPICSPMIASNKADMYHSLDKDPNWEFSRLWISFTQVHVNTVRVWSLHMLIIIVEVI
uniref:protein GAMETOPHYTE DEFECTIVE 1 isoform X2 n=1 Tax=Erigeron canadensis TaxID=72917 RepID=UPI001CB8BC84|nr:protein GAMETOPHYTE DEFECTIVE 1 isoform X2 [Erigeron canadensis]